MRPLSAVQLLERQAAVAGGSKAASRCSASPGAAARRQEGPEQARPRPSLLPEGSEAEASQERRQLLAFSLRAFEPASPPEGSEGSPRSRGRGARAQPPASLAAAPRGARARAGEAGSGLGLARQAAKRRRAWPSRKKGRGREARAAGEEAGLAGRRLAAASACPPSLAGARLGEGSRQGGRRRPGALGAARARGGGGARARRRAERPPGGRGLAAARPPSARGASQAPGERSARPRGGEPASRRSRARGSGGAQARRPPRPLLAGSALPQAARGARRAGARASAQAGSGRAAARGGGPPGGRAGRRRARAPAARQGVTSDAPWLFDSKMAEHLASARLAELRWSAAGLARAAHVGLF